MLKSPLEKAILTLSAVAASAPSKDVQVKLHEVIQTLTDIAIPS